MATFMPSQSHSGVFVNPYIGNIVQELHFLLEKTGKKLTPFCDRITTANPIIIFLQSFDLDLAQNKFRVSFFLSFFFYCSCSLREEDI